LGTRKLILSRCQDFEDAATSYKRDLLQTTKREAWELHKEALLMKEAACDEC
jgi:hypothetical protein